MMQRGRRSSAELATFITASPQRPPKPPTELSDAQADVWRAVVASLRSDWLSPAAFPMLIAFCRHVCRGRLIESQIATFEIEWARVEGGLERFDRLLKMAERETKAAVACARALRITPHSQMHPRTAGRRVLDRDDDGRRPWD